jgi:hypothetical protein
MSNKVVLCTCSKCKKKDTENIGCYVHPTTKWRHERKAKRDYNRFNLEEEINRLY